jgi:hypothetical protein
MEVEQELRSQVEGLYRSIASTNKRIDDAKMQTDAYAKTRFDDLDKLLAGIDKRLDDMKWFIGGVTTLFTIVFSILTLILGWNFNGEKASLHEFKQDVRAELGKVELPPQLELLGINGEALAGQEINASIETKPDRSSLLLLQFVLRNVGDGISGPLYGKVYSSEPIRFYSKSTDEKAKFKFEAYVLPTHLAQNEIPGKFSLMFYLQLPLTDRVVPPPGKYPVMVKLFYGKGKVAVASFFIVL